MPTNITTRRFVLREFRPADRAQFLAYQTDPAFTIFHDDNELEAANANNVFQLFLEWQQQTPRQNYQLAICMGSDDAILIGSCGVRMQGCRDGEAIFGIELARPYWGRFGYAQEASAALIGWAFATLDLSTLIADTAFGNAAVARLAEAAGFVRTHADDKQWWRLSRPAWNDARLQPQRTLP
ncbi:hypothetical protein ASC94_11990 [Massilia sp. Root418]|uniref:GNAT family N-acetyltransferase n=1 Tax=Massilia sp. Root418 TaxID=1736532 RepID=UPI0006F99F96|nr:GNAT family N-acetyltransferase [Massilia sp. Root418]KQW93357.1 hypothetical protein ASC94_11990 [Massilia sp. Root418]